MSSAFRRHNPKAGTNTPSPMLPNSSKASKGGFGSFTTSTTTLSYLTPPPDFSSIPHEVVVPFKNLLKKASTTKEKALQDVLAYVKDQPSNTQGLQDSIIQAYVELYPRLSIDDSPRVRELAHQLLFNILNFAKKRLAKKLPEFVGPWLAGTFDRDKRVARAASDALAAFLQTKEKEEAFWKAVQFRALEFAIEAIKETPDTLSDERSTTKQDADAKYYRVVGASLSLVLNLIRKGDLAALEDGLARYLEVDALWTMSKTEDAFVRRAFYQFLHIILSTKPELVKPRLQQIGQSLIADGLRNSQVGSSSDLLKVLASLTKHFPQVWGTQKHPFHRLHQFVSQGSQGGVEEFWKSLDELLLVLPDKSPSVEAVSAFLASMRKGIADRLETRPSRYQAFRSYALVFETFINHISVTSDFIDGNLSNLTHQYLHPSPESSLPSPQHPDFLVAAWIALANHPDADTTKAVSVEWNKLVTSFLSRLSNSLPEVSEGYQKSQQSIASEGERWFTLASCILSQECTACGSLQNLVIQSSLDILHGALDLLQRRNFKPFGAAAIIQSAVRHIPQVLTKNDFSSSLFPSEQPELYQLIAASPSLPYLVADLQTLFSSDLSRFEETWTVLVEEAVHVPDQTSASSAVKVLLAIPSTSAFSHKSSSLQKFLISSWKGYLSQGSSASLTELCEASLTYDSLTPESLDSVSLAITEALKSPEIWQSALPALEKLIQKKPELIPANHDLHVRLVTHLLAMTELSDSLLSEKAAALRKLLDKHVPKQNPLIRVLEGQLSQAGPDSLAIDTLVQQALSSLQSESLSVEDVFPSSTEWMTELSRFFSRPPNPSLSLTSSMSGAYFLAQGGAGSANQALTRDSAGRTVTARMALFTAKLLTSGVQLASLPPEFQLELVYLLLVTASLAGDQLAVGEPEGLWNNSPEALVDMQDFLDLSSAAVEAIVAAAESWRDLDMSGDSLLERLTGFMIRETQGSGPGAFYTAKALSSLFQALVKAHGPPTRLEEWITRLGVMRLAPDTTLAASAFLSGFGGALESSKVVLTLCTRLISEIPGCSAAQPQTLPSLVLLNLTMSVYEAGQVPVETRKQVLALQQMMRWAESPEEIGHQLAAEICKAIARFLPGCKDTYGPFWEQAIEYCFWLWEHAKEAQPEERLPYIHSSLKLMQAFHGTEDPNDDLQEALESHAKDESAGLISLLTLPREAPSSLPGELVDALLSRAVSKIPHTHLTDLSGLYESVSSESKEIQKAAFGLLHRALPAVQEDINLAVILDKKAAQLPDELLSLLLNAPNPDEYSDEDLAQFPAPIRSYLLAWHLVFDAYSKASFRVRSDYTENLRKDKYLDPLLNFLVDVLGHALACALDLDKEGFTAEHIRSYSIDLADSEPAERDMNWLLIHLFYLVLKYIPGLFKMWYFDCPYKQTKNTVQSWMEKFFSPLIISDALDEVVEWASKQEGGDPDTQELVVKVNKTMREITAGYPVDDDAATILLQVPKSYPLDPVEVLSVKRVAVRDDKWQAWLKGIKAVIMFGNCSLVDGLMAFRRNISLALKGQEECAICYSIIAQDKTLPDKKCGTCSHYFHRVCLYKWFQNSGRNTCPLCRNPIDYLGADTKRRRPEHE